MNTFEQLNNLMLKQLKALASQHKIANWDNISRNALLKSLIRISQERNIDLLNGERG